MNIARIRFHFIVAFSAVALLSGSVAVRAGLVVQISQNFTGSTYGVNTFSRPADANGDVGPAHYVELINGRFAIYTKTNGALMQSSSDAAFWRNSGITIPFGQEVSDPRVLFDSSSQRWFASAIVFDRSTFASNSFTVAVSESANPTGPWHGVSFVADPVNGYFADFPTLGVDTNGVYVAADMFTPAENSIGLTLASIPKADLLLSMPTATNATSFGILDYTNYGCILQLVLNPAGADHATIVAVDSFGIDFAYHSNLIISVISNAAGPGAATLSAPASVAVEPYFVPINPPQPDPTASDLDDGDARISAVARQVGNVIYVVHGTEVNVPEGGGSYMGQAAVRWYQINATNHSIIQSGTLSDSVMHYFYPSIAANAEGTVVIGCNGCSTNSFVSSYTFVGETVNGVTTFGPPVLLKAGTASYRDTVPGGSSRWGDYSATSVDPVDPTRFWTIQMVPSARQVYFTQITEVRAVKQPELTFTANATNITLSWPGSLAPFELETSTNLGPAAVWGSATASYVTNNGVITATALPSASLAFFRLKLQ